MNMENEAIIVGGMKIFINDPIWGDEEIYKGELTKLGRKVAVKKIRKDDYPDYEERINKELRAVRDIQNAKVSRLINVNDYDITEREDYYYIAYDHFDTTLKNVIDDGNETYDVKQILLNAVEGLEYLHSKGIFHRDIRPQNVLIQNVIDNLPNGAIGKISNCALSKELTPGYNLQSISRTLIPTGYIAPELYNFYMQNKNKSKRAKNIDSTVDVFSMGIVFFETLTNGFHPFNKGKDGEEQVNINKGLKPNFEPFYDKKVKLEKWEIEPAKQLIFSMLQTPMERPSASHILKHPFFWSKDKIEKFFTASSGYIVGNQKLEQELQNSSLDTTWANNLSGAMNVFLANGPKDPRLLKGTANLLRFVRNLVSFSLTRFRI